MSRRLLLATTITIALLGLGAVYAQGSPVTPPELCLDPNGDPFADPVLCHKKYVPLIARVDPPLTPTLAPTPTPRPFSLATVLLTPADMPTGVASWRVVVGSETYTTPNDARVLLAYFYPGGIPSDGPTIVAHAITTWISIAYAEQQRATWVEETLALDATARVISGVRVGDGRTWIRRTDIDGVYYTCVLRVGTTAMRVNVNGFADALAQREAEAIVQVAVARAGLIP